MDERTLAGLAIYYPGLETKSRLGAVDDTTPEGIVTACASVFGTTDDPPDIPGRRRDVVHPTAFDETLTERKSSNRIGHIYNHNWGAVLGHHIDIWPEKTMGLMAKSQHNLETFWGNEIFRLIQRGDISAYSFSFLPKRNTREQKSYETDADGVRHLYRVTLYELGPAPNAIAIHPDARVIEAKSGLYTDAPFFEMLDQAENVFAELVAEGEALAARREGRGPRQGRKSLSSDVIEAIEQKAERLEGLVKQLRVLTVSPEGQSETAPAHAGREVGSLYQRADLARARLRQLGITLE